MSDLTQTKNPKIVVIGGGTGSFTVLSGLRLHDVELTAVVTMADNGGSSGQLRDELGVLPPGDVRQCLVALAPESDLRTTLNYRFDTGQLTGHAFGNLLLAALEKTTGSFAAATREASRLLQLQGSVMPVTENLVTFCCKAGDIVIKGEYEISHAEFAASRPDVWLEPQAELYNPVAEALRAADMIVIAPGGLYGSLAPPLLTKSIGDVLVQSTAKKVYVCNLATKKGQTDGFTAVDYAAEVERFAGTKFLDYVVYNTSPINDEVLAHYKQEGQFAVRSDTLPDDARYQLIGADILASELWQNAATTDPLAAARTYIRHDAAKLARALLALL
jgi:uncharacterized cofD-like protein